MRAKLVERSTAAQRSSGAAIAISEIEIPDGEDRAVVWDTDVRGFGVVVMRTGARFVANFRADGKLRQVTLGEHGLLNVSQARERAKEVLGKVAGGVDPSAEPRARKHGVTLRAALADHVRGMRASECSPRSISTIESEVEKYLEPWLDRPLARIDRAACRDHHRAITEECGPYVANRVMREFRAIWNTALKVHEEVGVNPTVAVQWNKEHRRQEPIVWADLPTWRAKIDALPSVRRDYNLVVLLTGLRRMDAATIRWEHVDLDARTLHRPSPKGGEDRAFTIPLSTPLVEILERRRRENAELGRDDAGWAFPSDAIKSRPCPTCAALGLGDHVGGTVTHLAEPKEDDEAIVSPHRLRDTFITACAEVRPALSPYAIKLLVNHALPSRSDVTAGYMGVLDLTDAAESVASFLVERMRG
jgi:integrase